MEARSGFPCHGLVICGILFIFYLFLTYEEEAMAMAKSRR